MSTCKYCQTECADKFHDECLQEYDRRFKENVCVRCGQGKINHDLHLWCRGCGTGSPYLGYPGGPA